MSNILGVFAIYLSLLSSAYCVGTAHEYTEPQYFATVKCSFVIYGEFSYKQAKAACASRAATLEYFTHSSEERAVRQKLNWNILPGFLQKHGQWEYWVSKLWLGYKRHETKRRTFVWDIPNLPGVPVTDAPWIDDECTCDNGRDCVVMKRKGWTTSKCDGKNLEACGALCTAIIFVNEGEQNSVNYCNNYLVPPNSDSIVSLPMTLQKRYRLVEGDFSFYEAGPICWSHGCGVATAVSEIEALFIAKHVDLTKLGGTPRAWVGLSRKEETGKYTWNSGAEVSLPEYTWFDDEPNENYDCVYVTKIGERFGMKTQKCHTRMSVLCEEAQIL